MKKHCKNIKIAIVRFNYFPEEAHVLRDARALIENGVDVDVYCLRKPGEKPREKLGQITVIRSPLYKKRGSTMTYISMYIKFILYSLLTMFYRSLGRRYKVIISINPPDLITLSMLPMKIFNGARIVHYAFEYVPELFMDKYNLRESALPVKILKFIERLSLQLSDRVIAVHEMQKKRLSTNGIPPAKISVVHNVPSFHGFYSDYPDINYDSSEFVICSHGSILAQYGYDILLKGVAVLKDKIPELKLKIVGEGEYLSVLKKLADDLSIKDRVEFIGWVPFKRIPRLLSSCNVGVVPIRGYQMLPNKLMEYLFLGIPVVASDLDVLKAYFHNEEIVFFKTGDYFDLSMKILEVYNNYDNYLRRSKTLRKHLIERFHWRKNKEVFLSLIERLAT